MIVTIKYFNKLNLSVINSINWIASIILNLMGLTNFSDDSNISLLCNYPTVNLKYLLFCITHGNSTLT